MEQNQERPNRKPSEGIDLIELSVVLVATSNNPSILNPDFLFHSGIVDASRRVKDPRISTPAFSQVTFEDGLAVKADPDRVIFEQRGSKLTTEAIVCPEIAGRYLEEVPHVPYRAVGINPKVHRRSACQAGQRVAAALIDHGAWMSFKDLTPEIQLKAIYRYSDRTIFLDIAEAERRGQEPKPTPGMHFQANIHREIQANDAGRRIQAISSILSSWKDDLEDFLSVVAKFDSQDWRQSHAKGRASDDGR